MKIPDSEAPGGRCGVIPVPDILQPFGSREEEHWPLIMYDPAHPGEILKELVIEPLGLSVTAAAQHLGVSRKTPSKIVKELGDVAGFFGL